MSDGVATIERVPVPEKCPGCGRKNTTQKWGNSGWHPYIHIPDAPAVGCGACGHIVYVEESVTDSVRAELRAQLPKAAAGKITTKPGGKTHRSRKPQ